MLSTRETFLEFLFRVKAHEHKLGRCYVLCRRGFKHACRFDGNTFYKTWAVWYAIKDEVLMSTIA